MSTASSAAVFSRIRLIFVGFAALAVALFFTLGTTSPAHADDTGTLKVTIVDQSGSPVDNLFIEAVPADYATDPDSTENVVDTSESTTVPGEYDFALTPDTDYLLEVNGPDAAEFQTYGGEVLNEGTPVSVTAGETSSVDFSLGTEGKLTGKVTGPTGKGLRSVLVDVFYFDGTNWDSVSQATTLSSGAYSVDGLAPGSYKLEFADETAANLAQYSGGASTLDAASSLFLNDNATATVNAKLVAGGKLSGTVTAITAGKVKPLNDVLPEAFRLLPNGTGGYSGIDETHAYFGADTTANGKWTVTGLPTGAYVVYLLDSVSAADSRVVSAYVGGTAPVAHAANAQHFSVTAGKTTTRPGTTQLVAIGSAADSDLTLTVDNPSHAAYEGADVTLTSNDDGNYYWDSEVYLDETTDELGQVVIPNVPSGNYTLSVVAQDENGSNIYQPYVENFTYSSASPSKTVVLSDPTALNWLNGVLPQIDTNTAVGATHTVQDAAINLDGTIAFQWLRDGRPIYGATTDTYTAVGGDVGHVLTVRVSATAPNEDAIRYDATVGSIVSGAQIVPGGTAPSVQSASGTPWDEPLTLAPGTWSQQGTSYSVSWYDNGTLIPAAADQLSYSPTVAQIGHSITAKVIASKNGYLASNQVTTDAVVVGAGTAPTIVKAPKITSKKLSNGDTQFTASGTAWSRTTASSAYVWFVDGVEPANPFTASVVVPKADAAKAVTVEVSGVQAPDYLPSNGQEFVARKSTAAPTAGTAAVVHYNGNPVGATDPISVYTSVSAGSDPQVWHYPTGVGDSSENTYQWYRQLPGHAATKIAGATTSSYLLEPADIGATLTVRESSTNPTYPVGTVTVPAGVGAARAGLGSASVSISGSTTPGSTLVGSVSTNWTVDGVSQKQAWLVCAPSGSNECTAPSDFKAIAKAAGTSYTTLPTQHGDVIELQVTGSALGYAPVVSASAPFTLTGSTTIAAVQAPHLPYTLNAEPALVGDSYTAGAGHYDVSGLTYKYQWKVCHASGGTDCDLQSSWVAASGSSAKEATYKPVAADLTSGSTSLEFVETVSRAGYGTVSTASDNVVLSPAAARLPAPTADSSVQVVGSAFGDELTINGGSVFHYPGFVLPALSYQWYVSGKAVKGATNHYFDPIAADVNKVVTVKVRAVDPDYADGTYSASVTLGYAPEVDCTPLVYPTSGVVPGTVLTGDTGGCLTPGETFTYEWDARAGDGLWTAIPGAKKITYTPTIAQAGDQLRLDVQASVPGHQIGSESSSVITVGYLLDLESTSAPVVSGSTHGAAAVGTTLTVSSGLWSASGLTYAYQWYRNGVAIPGATTTTYTLTASSFGDDITAKVTASHAGYATVTAGSSIVSVTQGDAPQSTSAPVITGSATTGSVLAASTGGWNRSGLTFTYQWFSNGQIIDGATASTYTPASTATAPGITVEVFAAKTGYVTGNAISAAFPVEGSGDSGSGGL